VLKWSRVRLVLSILTCEGLFATLRERIQYASPLRGARAVGSSGGIQTLSVPKHYDYAGALHVHSTYSDGTGTVAEIALAANRAGLDFILMCDHHNLDAHTNGQDGWRGRTLVLVGTELSTDIGHLLAIGVPSDFLPTPGKAVAAQKSIQEHGGTGFVALPCDLKDHWRDFGRRLPGIGLEVFNLSAIARTKINLPALALVWSRYKSPRPQRAFHFVAARPSRELRLWDTLMTPAAPDHLLQPVVGIASVDAHAVMKFGGKAYPFPTYEEVFRTLRTHVVTRTPLSYGEVPAGKRVAANLADTALVERALADGHCYMSYDNYGDPTGFVFEAGIWGRDGSLDIAAGMGDSITLPTSDDGKPLTLRVQAPRTRTLVRLYHNGKLVAAARGGRLDHTVTEPGAYRAEVFLYRRRLGNLCLGAKPWIFSNPIYLQPAPIAVSHPSAQGAISTPGSLA
jgi:hypothetical protein